MSMPSSRKLGFSKLFLAGALVVACAIAVAPVFLSAASPLAIVPADAPAIIGNWEGTLSAGGASLRLVVHLTQGKDGALAGTMDSLDQEGANGMPLSNISYKEPKLHFDLAIEPPGAYDGSYDKDKNEISGHWQQGGQDLTLLLKRAK
jgi:hypothetical protein